MNQYLDFWNLMGYDFAGSWDSVAAHQANLYPSKTNPSTPPFSVSAAVEYYMAHGVPPSKIVLGMPLYGRAFTNTNGPGHSYNGVGEGSWEQGVWDYKVLPRPGAKEHYDSSCGASWSYDQTSRTMFTYDPPERVEEKARFVDRLGLGGGMWWESSCDRSVHNGSLIAGFVRVLGDETLKREQNCLEYPQSKFDNLRKGMPGE